MRTREEDSIVEELVAVGAIDRSEADPEVEFRDPDCEELEGAVPVHGAHSNVKDVLAEKGLSGGADNTSEEAGGNFTHCTEETQIDDVASSERAQPDSRAQETEDTGVMPT
jgi:hypothetical protein